MAAMTPQTPTSGQISTLDVLWAFYQSQPPKVKKAFWIRMEAEDKVSHGALWQQDLKEIKALKDNWDEEGAPKINRMAIRNVQKLMDSVPEGIAAQMRLYPTHLGAVMVKLETAKGRLKGEIGDIEMSYFVKRQGMATEHHSFEVVNKENLSALVHHLKMVKS